MNTKKSVCRGVGKAKGHEGCGTNTEYRRYGLCLFGNKCFQKWATTTDAGAEYIKKVSIQSKKNVKKTKTKEKQDTKIKLLSTDGYRKLYIQPKINQIARLIDFGQPCIATNTKNGKMNGGHRISTGSNRTLTYNLHNIFMQSEHSNKYKGGDDRRFDVGVIETYGQDYFSFLQSLKTCPPIKLNKQFLISLNDRLKDIKKNIKVFKRTPQQRIEERNRINTELGIYSKEFGVFN